MEIKLSQHDLWALRALVQKCGWGEFMNHIASLMAEQTDKVARGSAQDHALFNASVFIHSDAVQKLWSDCGQFDYRKLLDMIPNEHREVIEKNPPL